MVGPFKTAPGGLTHLLVAVDKFTKWIEAKPINKLDGLSTIKFFNEIITRYGVPYSIITDNGTNFAKGVFADYYGKKGIWLDLASVAHPQTKGQVEKANGLILAGIKPQGWSSLSNAQPAVGSRSYPQCSGAYSPLEIALLVSHLSSWSMEQKRCCPRTSSSMRPELSSTQRSKQKKLTKTASTSSRRHESRLWPD
jgi:hypothetical protein